MYQSRQIKKLLSVGDVVYSAQGGHEMVIREIYDDGFSTDEDFFTYDEVRRLYFLTKHGYVKAKEARTCTTSR